MSISLILLYTFEVLIIESTNTKRIGFSNSEGGASLNGAIDVIRTKVITEMNSMSGKKQVPYVMDTCYDIDELEDFLKAEKAIKKT